MFDAATIGDFFRTLYEMGFDETQIQSAVQAGHLSIQEATEWLLQGGDQKYRLQQQHSKTLGAAIDAFNPPKSHEIKSFLNNNSERTGIELPSSSSQAETSPFGSRLKLNRKGFEQQERERITQEVKAERRNKKKDHELALKRIADDRKCLQEKCKAAQQSETSAQQGQRLGGKVQTAVDSCCLLMFRLPSGSSFRERFQAEATLQSVKEHVAGRCPELQSFTFVQGFPKKVFTHADLSSTLKSLGLTPNATLCIQNAEPKPDEFLPLPKGAYSLTIESSADEKQEDASNPEIEDGNLEAAEESLRALPSLAQGLMPGNIGVHGVWQPPPRHHHYWGRGHKLVPGDEEDEDEAQEESDDNGSDEELIPGFFFLGFGQIPFLLPDRRGRGFGSRYQWPVEGNRLRLFKYNPLDSQKTHAKRNVAAQAAVERLNRASRDEQRASMQPSPPKKPFRLPQVPSLFSMSIKSAVTLMTAPSMQYISSLSSLAPELAEQLVAYMIKERLLRPKTLELFFGCQMQKLVLNCYPYATNELLRQLRAFHTLKHLSLVSCSLITDQGLSVVSTLQKLQHLNLSACVKLTDNCIQHIKGLKHLCYLSLDQTKVTDAGMQSYLESAPSSLIQLRLNRTDITENTLSMLPHKVPQLKLLSIKHTKVSDVSFLADLKALQTLHVDDTCVTENSLVALANHPTLSILSLSGIQTANGNDVLQIISGLQLSQLKLPSRHTVTDAGLLFLSHLQGISELDLTDYTHVTDEGVQHLANLHRLKKLSLSNTVVTDAGLPYLQNLRYLEDLCLDRTNVTSIGVSRCIISLPHLQVLGLACTHVGDNVVKQGLVLCKNLIKLNLSRTRITDKGLKYLCQLKLSQINLDGTGVSSTGVANLISSCPDIISIRASSLRVLSPDQVSDEEDTS
uniref:UBX domain-containing protein n=1 Tax=Latimeria chalumnae TaxID=7897 RepID=H3ALW3_LATCH